MVQKHYPPEPTEVDIQKTILLFSGFYGVLSSHNGMDSMSRSCPFCININYLSTDKMNSIVDTYNSELIITSSWRTIYQPLALSHLMRTAGAHIHDHQVSCLDDDPMNVFIPKSIKSYIDRFEMKPVFVIVDNNEFSKYYELFDDESFVFVPRVYADAGVKDYHIDEIKDKIENRIADFESRTKLPFLGRK